MSRIADHPIDPLFTNRWSPRSFTGEAVPDSVLRTAFEAARWAPSAMNAQPWRFLVTRPGDAWWETYLGLLMPRNRLWAAKASALVLILSAHELERRASGSPTARTASMQAPPGRISRIRRCSWAGIRTASAVSTVPPPGSS